MEKPATAFYLSLVAGVLVVLGGIVTASNDVSITLFFGANTFTPSSASTMVLGILGVACGALMIVGASMMFSRPERHVFGGALVLVGSIFSAVMAISGFVVGLLLGLLGGWKGVRWHPGPHDLESYVDSVINYLANTPGERSKAFGEYDRTGLDAVVSYLKERDPDLSAEDADAVAIRVIAERDKLVKKTEGLS